jgi:hypothetical protein
MENKNVLLSTNEEYILIDKLCNIYKLDNESETFDKDFINMIIDCDDNLFTKEEITIINELRINANYIKKNNFIY